MKKLLAILIVVGFGAFLMYSCQKTSQEDLLPTNEQNQVGEFHSLGCILLPAEEYAKIPVAKDLAIVETKATVNLSVPPIRNQGGEGSCVAWGTTYAARSIYWHKTHVAAYSTSVNIFSPEYVYNQIKLGSCTAGSYVTSGLNLLKSQGACRWSVMPYTDVSCSTYPNSTQKADAAYYKISSYSTVSRTTSAIKAQLAAGNPVIVAGQVNNAFMYLTANQILSTFSGSSLGGHCYCVVGYDDTKGAFKVMNSWGTSWGTSGFGWIKYGYESTWWQEAYVLN